jgi:hypothetical protein
MAWWYIVLLQRHGTQRRSLVVARSAVEQCLSAAGALCIDMIALSLCFSFHTHSLNRSSDGLRAWEMIQQQLQPGYEAAQ